MIKQYICFLLKSILSVRLSNSLWGLDILLFLEFIYIVSIFLYTFIEFTILLYTFSVISFAQYKKYMICLIFFRKFSDVLPAFSCVGAIGNLWISYLEFIILRLEWSKKPVPPIFIGNILPSKAWWTLPLSSERLYKFLRKSSFCCFFSEYLGFTCFQKFKFQLINHFDHYQLLLVKVPL